MFTENIKKCIIPLLLTSAMILTCGCQSTKDIPQISDSGTSAPSQNATNKDDVITTAPEISEIVTTVTESEIVAAPAETTEKELEFVPDEWINIGDSFGILVFFNSVINADCSEGEISDVIHSLVRKNVLYSLTRWGNTFEIDWDNPITYRDDELTRYPPGKDELTLYPALSVFFPDVKSIYDLAYSVYGTNNDIYTYDPDTNSFYQMSTNLGTGAKEPWLFFTEIDGKMYVDPNCIVAIGAPEPFRHYTYIEITEQTEDMCKLTWHYPDVEGINEPDKYISYYYYERYFTARYIDGAWRLDRVIG